MILHSPQGRPGPSHALRVLSRVEHKVVGSEAVSGLGGGPVGCGGVSWGSWDCTFPGKKLAKEVQGSGTQEFWAAASSECPCELQCLLLWRIKTDFLLALDT